jgi:hypothetical protein
MGFLQAARVALREGLPGARAVWEGMGMDRLVSVVGPMKTEMLEATLLVASELASRPVEGFQIASELEQYCYDKEEAILNLVLSDPSERWPKRIFIDRTFSTRADAHRSGLIYAPRGNLKEACPALVGASLPLHLVVLVDAMWRKSLRVNGDPLPTKISVRVADTVLKPDSLRQGMILMTNSDRESLQQGIEFLSSTGSVSWYAKRLWFSSYSDLIFGASGFFEEGEIPAQPSRSSAEYRAVGRFLGLAVLHTVSLGISVGRDLSLYLAGTPRPEFGGSSKMLKRYRAVAQGFADIWGETALSGSDIGRIVLGEVLNPHATQKIFLDPDDGPIEIPQARARLMEVVKNGGGPIAEEMAGRFQLAIVDERVNVNKALIRFTGSVIVPIGGLKMWGIEIWFRQVEGDTFQLFENTVFVGKDLVDMDSAISFLIE